MTNVPSDKVDAVAINTKILIYDGDCEAVAIVKAISKGGSLITPKSEITDILDFLQNANYSQTDISAIFLTEEKDDNQLSGFEIAKHIHRSRNNIPIFVRLTGNRTIKDLDSEHRKLVTGCYNKGDQGRLKEQADQFLFGYYFPPALVDIFVQSGLDVLEAMFKGCDVRQSMPFLVYDHITTTEYTSLLSVNFPFGNGVLALLIKEDDIKTLIQNDNTALNADQIDSDYMNQLISEAMNMYWGKVRHASDRAFEEKPPVQVINLPLVVNHTKNYISFGNNAPQLCFRYIVMQNETIPAPFIVEFKVVFNSLLNPESFVLKSGDDSEYEVDDGFLELF